MPCNIDPANCMVHRIVHVARLSWSAGHRRSEAKTAPPWAEIRRPDLAPHQWHFPHHAEPALGEVNRRLGGGFCRRLHGCSSRSRLVAPLFRRSSMPRHRLDHGTPGGPHRGRSRGGRRRPRPVRPPDGRRARPAAESHRSGHRQVVAVEQLVAADETVAIPRPLTPMLLLNTASLLSALFRTNFERLPRASSRPADVRPLHHYLGLSWASTRGHPGAPPATPAASCSTPCYAVVMVREISQRELRNESGEIMRQLDRGETFVVTRSGVPVGELVPLRRHRFITAEAAVAVFHDAPRVDYAQFRDDLGCHAAQDAVPRA